MLGKSRHSRGPRHSFTGHVGVSTARLVARTMPWQDVCLSVRLSVRPSVCHRYVETAKRIKTVE